MIYSMLLVNVDQVQQNWSKINYLQTSKILLHLPSKNLSRLFHVNKLKLIHHLHQKMTPFCFLHPSLPQYAWLTNIASNVFLRSQSHDTLDINGDDCSLLGRQELEEPKDAVPLYFFSGGQKKSFLVQFLYSHAFSHPHQTESYPTLASFYIQGGFTPNMHRPTFQSCLLTSAPSLTCNCKTCLNKMDLKKQLIKYVRRINMLLV